jgi:hypothetical protein
MEERQAKGRPLPHGLSMGGRRGSSWVVEGAMALSSVEKVEPEADERPSRTLLQGDVRQPLLHGLSSMASSPWPPSLFHVSSQ